MRRRVQVERALDLGTIPRAVGGPRAVSPRSRSEAPARTVPARRTAADPAWTGAEWRGAARARGRRADHDPAIWVDAHGLGLHAGGFLHREVHDAPPVPEHRSGPYGLAAGALTRARTR